MRASRLGIGRVRAAVVVLAVGVMGGADAPRPLARYFPGDDLVVYAEFDGLDAHADAWKRTAAFKMLTETPTGAMLKQVFTGLFARSLESSPDYKLSGPELMTVLEHGFRYGFAVGINRKEGAKKPHCVGLVLRGAARGPIRGIVGRLIDSGSTPASTSEAVSKPGGRKVIVVSDAGKPWFAWWSEGEDVVVSLVSPAGADAMIGALEDEAASAVQNATRAGLAKPVNGFEPVGLAFFDMAALPELPNRAAALGLDRLRRFEYQWGFEGEALMTVTRVVAPAPRSGVLALLDQPTFDVKTLPPLPSGLDGFNVFTVAPAKLYDQFKTLAQSTDPETLQSLANLEGAVRDAIGVPLRDDLLGHLGPLMVAYTVPTKINAPTNPLTGLGQALSFVPKSTLIIDVDDAEAFGKVLDAVADHLKQRKQAVQDQPNPPPKLELVPLRGKGLGKAYRLSVPSSLLPLPAGLRPTILLGKKHVVIGTTFDAAHQALALEGRDGGLAPDDPLAAALKGLPGKMTILSVTDTKNSLLAEAIANLPGIVQLMTAPDTPESPLSAITQQLGVPSLPLTPDRAVRRPPLIAIDPNDIPAPDELREYLFPASYALTADDEGFRLISREPFPALNPTSAAPIAVALLLPAVQSARTAARRAQSVNNLKQIGLALHNFHDTSNHFPNNSADKSGKPLLSWRVAVLPFLGEPALFNEFKQDEPWDSPHNRALIERMPSVYVVPGATAEPGQTFYQGFTGKGTFFDPTVKDGVKIQDVLDGTSNTIGVLEARTAVPWSKPDDNLAFDSDKMPMTAEQLKELNDRLGGHFPGGFNALFLDGSVRFIKDSVNGNVLQGLITRAGGEVISSDSF